MNNLLLLFFIKNSTINTSQGLANNSHIALISLSKASYLDTGYYYCDPLSEDSKLDEEDSKKIYIYVQRTYLNIQFIVYF